MREGGNMTQTELKITMLAETPVLRKDKRGSVTLYNRITAVNFKPHPREKGRILISAVLLDKNKNSTVEVAADEVFACEAANNN